MDRFNNECILCIGNYCSLKTFYRLLTIFGRTDCLSKEYQMIAPVIQSDLLPFHASSLLDAFAMLKGKDRILFLLEMEDHMIGFLYGMEELDIHFFLDRDEYADIRVWRLMDGLRLIHHPAIYAKVFALRHYSFEDILSMLTGKEMDELLESMIPLIILEQLFSYQWTCHV